MSAPQIPEIGPSPIDETWYRRDPALPPRTSAGGVVVRIEGGNLLVALVRERAAWGEVLAGYVLPKGGVEPGEDIEAGARREVAEEAGLTEVTALTTLAVLERQDYERAHWSTCHYLLFITSQLEGAIRDTEHHFGFGWFPAESLPPMFWPDERQLLEAQRRHIYEHVIAHQNPKGRKPGFM